MSDKKLMGMMKEEPSHEKLKYMIHLCNPFDALLTVFQQNKFIETFLEQSYYKYIYYTVSKVISDSDYLLSHVGALPLHVPVIEVPSPPHVRSALSDKAKPSIHVKVQLLL